MALNVTKACRYNRASARTVGWIEKSTEVFAELGVVGVSPSEVAFATAVEAWQRKNGVDPDGMLGPGTWQVMEPRLPKKPSSALPPELKVDWFKVAPKASPTRGKLLVREGNVVGGANLVNDAYDLALYEMSDGNYELELFMKVQFFFKDGSGGEWTDSERQSYLRDWRTAVTGAWSAHNLHTTKSGKKVSLVVRLETQDGGFMWDHWEIEVEKIAGRKTSNVKWKDKTSSLDSGDLVFTFKSRQTGHVPAVHEFGHMLGNPDEYKGASLYLSDTSSLMHSGSDVRPRHLSGPREWVIAKLKSYGIQ